jgi:hypothetical protein
VIIFITITSTTMEFFLFSFLFCFFLRMTLSLGVWSNKWGSARDSDSDSDDSDSEDDDDEDEDRGTFKEYSRSTPAGSRKRVQEQRNAKQLQADIASIQQQLLIKPGQHYHKSAMQKDMQFQLRALQKVLAAKNKMQDVKSIRKFLNTFVCETIHKKYGFNVTLRQLQRGDVLWLTVTNIIVKLAFFFFFFFSKTVRVLCTEQFVVFQVVSSHTLYPIPYQAQAN